MHYRLTGLVLTSMLMISCASSQTGNQPKERSDLLEGFNRSMFNFNYNMLDPYVLRPFAVAWRNYVPIPVRTGLSNFLSNLDEPYTMVNYFIEGNPYKAMVHFNRFFLNTLLGMSGFIDLATMTNQKLAKEGTRAFGSTLGYYSVGYGTYIELPVYGGFTPREDIGGLVDNIYPPLSWLTWWMSAGKWALEGIETRTQLLDSDPILKNSKDPYSFVHAAYFQHHDFLASDEKLLLQENPNAPLIEGNINDIDSQ